MDLMLLRYSIKLSLQVANDIIAKKLMNYDGDSIR